MKRSLILGLVLMMFIAAIWLAYRSRPVSDEQYRTQKESGLISGPQTDERARTMRGPSPKHLPLVQMNEKPYVVDRVAQSRSHEKPPFEFRGGPGTGRVIDQEGKVLMDSGDDISIFGADVGPDREHVLIKGGEGINYLMNPAAGLKTKLPTTPPGGLNMFPFDWYWIGERSLLGVSGVERLGPDGKPVKSDDNVAESRLYVYDLMTKQLSEVALPAKFTHAVFTVMEAIPDGHVHLGLEESEYTSWCEIAAPE